MQVDDWDVGGDGLRRSSSLPEVNLKKKGNTYVSGSSFEVKGAGEWYVNGEYSRTAQKCCHADVFRKTGSSLVLIKKGEEGWSLVDLRGSTALRWTLRSVELYFCPRIPPGPTPPPVGWGCVEGEGPAPMLHIGKSPMLPFLVPPTKSSVKVIDLNVTSSSWVSRAAKKSAEEAVRNSITSEPRFPRKSVLAAQAGLDSSQLEALRTAGSRADRAPPGAVTNFLRSFRIVLSRPNARVPWGFKWEQELFQKAGARILEGVLNNSPLDRWNVWQHINGRPDLAVLEGDRLIKADGRWSFHEQEVSTSDSEQAPQALALQDAEGADRTIVLEFVRPAVRPAAPMKPRLEVWDTQSSLVISWDPPNESMEPYEQVWGWAVAVLDLDHNLWYIVDGATYSARTLSLEGNDVAVAKPELCTIYVSDGVAHGRSYAACVAMLTDNGWSAFSELSRSTTLRSSAKISDSVLGLDPEDDDWPERPRFACPKKLVPGASAPIELRPGPRDLLSQERWLRMEVCIEDDFEGLLVAKADSFSKLLIVEKVVGDSPMARWNQKQASLEVHGFAHRFCVQAGDVINKINGFTGAQAMLYELSRKPPKLVMTVDRHCGGNTTLQEIPEAKLFAFHRLDWNTSRDVEEFDWHVLLSQAEGILCARMVERDAEELEKALSDFHDIHEEGGLHMVNEGIAQEADRRILLDRRIDAVLHEAEATMRETQSTDSRPASRGDSIAESRMESRSSMRSSRTRSRGQMSSSKDIINSNDEIVLIKLRKAMADVAMDEEKLARAVKDFVNSSKVVRQSIAGKQLLEHAQALQELWKWRRQCSAARSALIEVKQSMLAIEAEHQDDDGEFHDFTIQDPPYDLLLFTQQLEICEAFRPEMGFLVDEGRVVLERMQQSNLRFSAEKRIRSAMVDEREDDFALEEALNAGEALGVNQKLIEEGREQVVDWKANHHKTALHDELFQAVKELRRHVDRRMKPGAGAREQQRMRVAIAGSGLSQENPLVLEAWGLLRQWEQDNVALRAEARLASAVERVEGGFNPDVPEAGDLLGSAIAEVAQQGVDAKFLDEARTSLAFWQASRLKRAREELATAMRYADEDYLKESLALAKIAGIDEETIEQATRQLARLRMVDEVNKLMDKTMEDPAFAPLEKAVQTAHSSFFIEEDMDMLCSGSLQARLRFWAQEIQGAVQSNQPEGLDASVRKAMEVVRKSQEALENFRQKQGTANKVPDVAVRTLERDMRALQLAIPGGRDMANVYIATNAIERVLGAVERYASQLPEVIKKADAQVAKGLNKSLVVEAIKCKQEYDATVKALTDAVSNEHIPGDDLKQALVEARMAGAPEDLVNAAFEMLEQQYPDLHSYAKVELELLIAKQEADDIQELSAEGRFLRLQDAADAAKQLVPRIERSILEEVEDISMALAAERSFVLAVQEAKDVLAGQPMSPDQVTAVGVKLEHAIQACDMDAQEEAKKGIPEAEDLRTLLEEEVEKRRQALDNALELAAARGTSMRDLIISIVSARQASVPADLLEEPYAKLRKKKLDFVTSALRNACVSGKYALAYGLYHRGLALKAAEERNGGEWRSGQIEAEIRRLRTDIITVNGSFTSENSGGSFGTNTWRKNPCYLIRPQKRGKAAGAKRGKGSTIRVSVALAEAGDFPATLAVHVVRNGKAAHVAGMGKMLMPGFEVISASNEDNDIPDCEFDLPSGGSSKDAPIFIVPSSARGELGPYTLIINATEPVDITEIPHDLREPQEFHQSFDVMWVNERPYAVTMGGGRTSARAPLLSWYRNPQFRVRVKQAPAQPVRDAPQKEAAPTGDSAPQISAAPSQQAEEVMPQTLAPDQLATITEEKPHGAEELAKRIDTTDKERLREIFDSCDTQGNGMINKRELIKAVRRDPSTAEFFGLPHEIRQEDGSRDKMESLFQAIDNDQDREITWEEFLTFYQVSVVLGKATMGMATEEASEVPSLSVTPAASKGPAGGMGEEPPSPASPTEPAALPLDTQAEEEEEVLEVVQSGNASLPTPILAVILVPKGGRPKAAPASLHIVRNMEGQSHYGTEEVLVAENPSFHSVLACSGLPGREYSSASEVGASIKIDEKHSEPLIVVPSLKSTSGQGKFTITFLSNRELEVERIQ
eukprot:TRINITY_DN8306_c0_g1_i7.p1 TRINITY_DN8306_c0_g1~~TRINITY_DN8306_c0_g1_i7.p1  ORF type:complete len:2146 (-),score=473.90 TRINITY_DN8306_c0_g1_i7:103-6483(-)